MSDERFLDRKITKKNGEQVPIRELKPDERVKYEIAEELGLFDRIIEEGWGEQTDSESGRIRGIIKKKNSQKKKE